ncbi:Dihydrofolate reductase [Friedmanniella luteola]|uniref:Dihydrofolate reductase n=1 Tax=Friedmanniella luteola TaxID=546871 RepID=A0A1H1MK64_9ACTN|nr:dihydrofolate reductase family protein [Friedmanniella luteola]SDR87047.1 Dihydrofolate reductase [Friedmanniella luteola]
MRTLTYYVAATVDGFIAGPAGEFDFFGFEGDSAAWIMAEYPETLPAHARGPLGLTDTPSRQFDTVLMGRRTYEPGLALGIRSPYPHLRQLVFSRSLDRSTEDVEVVAEDPVAVVRRLKQQDGAGLWLAGGGELAGCLRDEVDVLLVKRNPVVIGTGVPLFAGPFRPAGLTPAGTRTFETGVVVETYRRS